MQNICSYLVESELFARKNQLHRFLTNRVTYSNGLYYKDLRAHYGCVNAIEFSKKSESHFISAGDDKRVLLWNINDQFFSSSDDQSVQKSRPRVMPGQHNSNIFTLAWDNDDQRIFSGSNDHQVIVHQADTGQICDIFLHERAVLGISVHPKQSQIFATACESGELSLYDLRLSNTDPIILSSNRSNSSGGNHANGAFYTCAFNPVDPNMLAAGHELKGLSLFDLRTKSVLMRYKTDDDKLTSRTYKQNVMSVFFNQSGSLLGALRFSNRPVIYQTSREEPVFQFDHEEFSNCCTQKSGCFMGENDEYFVTGSDNFSVYVWRVPSSYSSHSSLNTTPHLILKSHRSIVNQCRFNSRYYMLATSGVEKVIKVWSPYLLPSSSGGSLIKEIEPVHKIIHISHDPTIEELRNREENQTVDRLDEDQMVIAYFDAQVKRVRGDLGMSDPVNESSDSFETIDIESELSASSLSSLETSLSESSNRRRNKSRPRVRESSSSQSKSSSEEEVSPGEDINIDHLLVDKAAKARRDRSKRNIKLRNKLRNLRHRRSLNLTEESEYLSVLGSLNVSTNGVQEEDAVHESTSTATASVIGRPSIEIGDFQLEPGSNSNETMDLIPKSATSSSTMIRSLNEHKRKLELEIEEKTETKISNDESDQDATGLRFKKRAKDKKSNYRKPRE